MQLKNIWTLDVRKLFLNQKKIHSEKISIDITENKQTSQVYRRNFLAAPAIQTWRPSPKKPPEERRPCSPSPVRTRSPRACPSGATPWPARRLPPSSPCVCTCWRLPSLGIRVSWKLWATLLSLINREPANITASSVWVLVLFLVSFISIRMTTTTLHFFCGTWFCCLMTMCGFWLIFINQLKSCFI